MESFLNGDSMVGGLVSRARLAACATVLVLAGSVGARQADAQVVYTYAGNAFTIFSCGPSADFPEDTCGTPAPTNPYTSYTALNRVTAMLTLAAPLPANITNLEIWALPGFSLTLSDGSQTLYFSIGDPNSNADAVVAGVTTDSLGRIVNWDLALGSTAGGTWIETQKETNQFGTAANDYGILRWGQPPLHADYAANNGAPGTWTYPTTIGPEEALRNLIALLSDTTIRLRRGQFNSFLTQLNDVLTSFLAGQIQQAINQLNSFINHVNAAYAAGQLAQLAAERLISEAQAILEMLEALAPAP